MKIILTGDLHLGRTSTRIPDEWRPKCRTVQAWKRLVEEVISVNADLLIISGDIVDARNQLWEAMAPLQEGLKKLAEAGVRTLAVSGNHDADSLPDLAEQFPDETFTLLGKGGRWQRETILKQGQPVLHIDGWSFPKAIVKIDPTLDYPATASSDGIPVLGLVHGDLGAAESHYAPLNLARLQQHPVSAWLLGHIHRPQLLSGAPWVLMPGSPHPMDPGEPGRHHAWQCDLSAGRLSKPVPFCPAVLEYAYLDIPILVEDPAGVDFLRGKIETAVKDNLGAGWSSLRIRLTGKSGDIDAWQECTDHLRDWTPGSFRIDRVELDLHPLLNMEEVKKAGPVPRLLVEALESMPPGLETRLAEVLEKVNRQRTYDQKELPPLELDHGAVERYLEQVLRKSLEQLT